MSISLWNGPWIRTSVIVGMGFTLEIWQRCCCWCRMRQHMVADFGLEKLNEQLLFHGTQSQHVDGICKEGFDWRMCGTNGTAFGQGGWQWLFAVCCGEKLGTHSSKKFQNSFNIWASAIKFNDFIYISFLHVLTRNEVRSLWAHFLVVVMLRFLS